MKKLLVMVCILAMVLSMAPAAFAATEPAAVILTVDDVRDDLYEAVTLEVAEGFTMDIPASFTVTTEDEVTVLTDGTYTIEITTQAADECEYTSVEEAKKAFIEAGLQNNMVELTINGLPALGFVTEDDTYTVIVELPNGQITTIKFLDFSTADDVYKAWIENMLKSFVEI